MDDKLNIFGLMREIGCHGLMEVGWGGRGLDCFNVSILNQINGFLKCGQNIVSYLSTSKVILFYKVCTSLEHYKMYKSNEKEKENGDLCLFRNKWSDESQ